MGLGTGLKATGLAAYKLAKGTLDVTGKTGKAIYNNPRKTILSGSLIAYLNSPLSDNAKKQRIKMMLENYRQGLTHAKQ
jgi:hypothetical protein